jgi:hypothetical protein
LTVVTATAGPPPAVSVSPATISDFHRDGFVAIAGVTSVEDLDRINRILARLYRRYHGLARLRYAGDLGPGGDPGVPEILEINQAIELAPELESTLTFARCRALAEALLGRAVEYRFDHAIYKPAFNGRATAWHQDAAYTLDPRLVTAHFWVPMYDVSVARGCMQFIPGSHRGPLRPHRRRGGSAEAHALEAEGVDPSLAVACPVASGGATAHLPRTLHYTGPNLTDEPRLAWILEFGVAPGRWRTLRHTLGRLARPAGPRAAPRPPSA